MDKLYDKLHSRLTPFVHGLPLTEEQRMEWDGLVDVVAREIEAQPAAGAVPSAGNLARGPNLKRAPRASGIGQPNRCELGFEGDPHGLPEEEEEGRP